MEEKEFYNLETDYSVHPGHTIKEIIDFNGVDYEKFANTAHLDLIIVKKIVDGKLNVTEEIAKKLTKAIPKIPYTFWLSMQKHYDETYLDKKDQ